MYERLWYFVKKLWGCVFREVKPKNFLSNKLIKVKFPQWRDKEKLMFWVLVLCHSIYSWFSLSWCDGHVGVQNNGKMSFNFCIIIALNSSPIDEFGSWYHPRLVGALCKYQAEQGGSMATLWAGTSPASNHQPTPSHWRNFSGNLPYPIPALNHFLWGWEGGWGQDWQNGRPKQRSTKLNWASKLQIWWPKQWSVQGSDP